MWRKLEACLGPDLPTKDLLAADFDTLRACGLSRQKQGYARSLAELVISGALPLDAMPADDEEAIAYLTQVKGIGRWSAEIYLLFAEARPDILGGTMAWHGSDGEFTQIMYFTSEEAARSGEVSPAEEAVDAQYRDMMAGEPTFIDLPDPRFD